MPLIVIRFLGSISSSCSMSSGISLAQLSTAHPEFVHGSWSMGGSPRCRPARTCGTLHLYPPRVRPMGCLGVRLVPF